MIRDASIRPNPGDILPARLAIEKIPEVDLSSPIEVPDIPENEINLTQEETDELTDKILKRKKELNALIVSHNYQIPGIHKVSDFSGDSLYLAQKASESNADIIIEPAVLFMPEILAVMNVVKGKKQIILAPSKKALCSLAAHADPNKILAWKKANPKGIVIMYVNTYVETKALTDYCCASANAHKVIEHVAEKYPDAPLLFGPDVNLGYFAVKLLQRMGHSIDRLSLIMGACHVHDKIRAYHVLDRKKEYPNAATLVHPECGCTASCMRQVDAGLIPINSLRFGSTSSMFKQAEQMPEKEIIIATETGMIPVLSRAIPDKKFIPANPEAVCEFMKQNTLRNLYESLRNIKHVITVDPNLARAAYEPIRRMLEIV